MELLKREIEVVIADIAFARSEYEDAREVYKDAFHRWTNAIIHAKNEGVYYDALVEAEEKKEEKWQRWNELCKKRIELRRKQIEMYATA